MEKGDKDVLLKLKEDYNNNLRFAQEKKDKVE